jgi:hypothetical protein
VHELTSKLQGRVPWAGNSLFLERTFQLGEFHFSAQLDVIEQRVQLWIINSVTLLPQGLCQRCDLAAAHTMTQSSHADLVEQIQQMGAATLGALAPLSQIMITLQGQQRTYIGQTGRWRGLAGRGCASRFKAWQDKTACRGTARLASAHGGL